MYTLDTSITSVSYTHLDVYKRQSPWSGDDGDEYKCYYYKTY